MTEIPEVSTVVVNAIVEKLKSDRGMLRPPEKAAHLLALIVELHKQNRPFPPREEIARAIGASISTIDAAISTRLSEGYITMAIDTLPGNVRRRGSVTRQRYYLPSKELLDVVAEAKRLEQRVKDRRKQRLL